MEKPVTSPGLRSRPSAAPATGTGLTGAGGSFARLKFDDRVKLQRTLGARAIFKIPFQSSPQSSATIQSAVSHSAVVSIRFRQTQLRLRRTAAAAQL